MSGPQELPAGLLHPGQKGLAMVRPSRLESPCLERIFLSSYFSSSSPTANDRHGQFIETGIHFLEMVNR
jgi:hypothetical protein